MGCDPGLEPDAAMYYESLIGILRWMIALGRIDKINEVLLLSSHQALPREGHLNAAGHVMSYVGKKYNLRLVYDPTYILR